MKKIFIIGCSLFILCIPIRVWAQEDKSDIVITFDLTVNDRFIYEVRVSEGGCLYDGSQRITNGVVAYQMSVGEIKEFTLEPNSGYEVKKIMMNGKSISTVVDRIKISGVSARSVLEVIYGRIEENTEPVIPNEPNSQLDKVSNMDKASIDKEIDTLIPLTGDVLKIGEYVCLILIVLYRVYVSRRGIDTIKCVDNIAISTDIAKIETNKEEKRNEE